MRTANVRTIAIRTLVALVGAAGWSVLALARGEDVSAAWMVAAALGSYAIGYRFCSKVIAYKVLKVDATRATPAGRLNDGIDFHPTDRRVPLGHHVAAIAGAEPRARTTRRHRCRHDGRSSGCGRNVRKEIPARASAAADAADAAVDASQNRHTDMRTRSSAHPTP